MDWGKVGIPVLLYCMSRFAQRIMNELNEESKRNPADMLYCYATIGYAIGSGVFLALAILSILLQ